MIGYEIKTSRSDFLKDDKWQGYLPLCNELWFVCPTGLIDPAEVPGQSGLIWVSKNGRMLITKRKAAHRDIPPPINLLLYALICRTDIRSERVPGVMENRESRAQFWRNWLVRKGDLKSLGWSAAKAIRKRAEEVENENRRLKLQMEGYDDIRRVMTGMGLNPDNYNDRWQAVHKIRDILPPWMKDNIVKARDACAKAVDSLEDLERRSEEHPEVPGAGN